MFKFLVEAEFIEEKTEEVFRACRLGQLDCSYWNILGELTFLWGESNRESS